MTNAPKFEKFDRRFQNHSSLSAGACTFFANPTSGQTLPLDHTDDASKTAETMREILAHVAITLGTMGRDLPIVLQGEFGGMSDRIAHHQSRLPASD
jgi:hypothetical protein